MEKDTKDINVLKANRLVSAPVAALKKIEPKKKLKVYDEKSTQSTAKEIVKTHSAIDEKLMNACIFKMQSENVGIKYQEIKSRALSIVEKMKIDAVNHKDVFECAVEEEARKILRAEIKKIYVFDTHEILSLCGIEEENLRWALNKLKKFQNLNASLITEYIPNSALNDVVEQVSSVNPIPRITVRPNEIEVELQSYAVPYLFALAHGFTKVNLLQIQQLKSSYALRLYDIITMLYKIQERKTYEFQELQALFGTNYKTLTEFKKNVLSKAITEINDKSDMSVELIKLHGQKLRFKIIRKSQLDRMMQPQFDKTLSIADLSHFLVCEQFFKNMGRVNAVKDFEKYKAGILKILQEKKEEELEIEYKIAEPHFAAIPKIQKILKENQTNYTYDEKYMVVRTDELAQNDYGFVRLGDNPAECLCELEKSFMQQTPPLPSPLFTKKEDATLTKKSNWPEELIEPKQVNNPNKILNEIVEMGSFLYFDSEQTRNIIDKSNINIFMAEMVNRIINSRDYERFFSFPSPAQKLLFVKISNE